MKSNKSILLFEKKKIYPTLLILKGALTGRPYQFLQRPWEHLYQSVIDQTNSFGHILKAELRNNIIYRSLPGLINTNDENLYCWIDNKSRFSFEGIPIDSLFKTISYTKKKSFFFSIKSLTNNIANLIYFFDHLNNHLIRIKSFIFILGKTLSIEMLSIILLTFSKYSFIKIRTTEINGQTNDLESSYQISSKTNGSVNLLKSDLCILINVNTRYEGSYLNLKLRKRYLTGNFCIISLSSLLDLTFPIILSGSTNKILTSTIEGANLISQTIRNSNNPIFIFSSEYLKRVDNKHFEIFIEILKSYSMLTFKSWNGLNILNSDLSENLLKAISNFKEITKNDYLHSGVFFFLNSPLYMFSLKKLIEMKILNFLFTKNNKKSFFRSTFLLNPIEENKLWLMKKIEIDNYNKNYFFYLKTKNFCETLGTYLNNLGIFKTSISITSLNTNLTTDWKFIRKIFKLINKKIVFTQMMKNNKQIYFRISTLLKLKIYIALHFFPSNTFTSLNFNTFTKNEGFVLKKCVFFLLCLKTFNNKTKLWLRDFNIGNKDLYSRHSKTLVKSSNFIKFQAVNFLFN